MIDIENIPHSWTVAKFEDLLDYIQPTKYIVESTDYDDSYKTPVLTAGKSFIIGHTNEKTGIFNSLPTIIFDDFTTATQFVSFPFKVKSSAMKILQPTCDLVNLKLAYYYMQTVTLKGETHKRFWISEYSQLPVPLPPYSEQIRLLKKIEELLTDLDKGIEILETAQGQLRVYRQAVLKWAFEGISEKLPLGEVAIIKRGKSKHRPRNAPELFGGKYPFIQTGDVRSANGKIVNHYTETYSEIGLKQSKLWPKGTLCLTIAANIADTAFLGFDACFPDSVVGITSDPGVLNLHYVNYYIQKIKQEIESKASATAQKNINVDFLERLEIPFPKPDQQIQIVHEIERRLSVCDKIEETIEISLKQSEAFRLSILKKAFEGKLVRQNPNDESAEKLLERIRAEKRSLNGAYEKPKTKKNKTKNVLA